MSVTLSFKSNSGKLSQIQVEELVSVDGVAYRGGTDELRDALIHMQGELNAIKDIIGLRGQEHVGD